MRLMDFRGVEHSNTVRASGGDFSTPRPISSAAQIPPIGPFGFDRDVRPIRLRGVVSRADEAEVAGAGAYRNGAHWFVDRTDPFPFHLERYLPRMAWRSVTPEISDMIPKVCWGWSLARLMVAADWNALCDRILAQQRVCYECGGIPVVPRDPKAKWAKDSCTKRLDGHEVWSFNGTEPTGFTFASRDGPKPIVGVQRLVSIQMLCGRCHETKHIGNAGHRSPHVHERAFARLGAINRVSFAPHPHGEAAAYLLEIRRKYATRNMARSFWAMDFAALGGEPLRLVRTVSHAGDGLLVRGRRDGSDGASVRVINADISEAGGHVVVTPRGWRR